MNNITSQQDLSSILIIRHTSSDFISKLIKSRGYICENMYIGGKNLFLRTIRRIFFKFKLPLYHLWYNKQVLKYKPEIIIIFESLVTPEYIKWLYKKTHVKNLNVWYWNTAKNTVNPNLIDEAICKKWSFSRLDCAKYKMRFNPPPYFKEIKKPHNNIQYDIVFVGKDKGRLKDLLELKNKFEDMGLTTNFIITPTNRLHKSKYYSKPIPYEKSIEISCSGKAILDYIEIDNSGQSMRVLEALFLKKKIITNSKLIVDYDFYRKENIFVLGIDDLNNLKEFLNSPYVDIDQKLIDQYDFSNFIERFINNNSFSGVKNIRIED